MIRRVWSLVDPEHRSQMNAYLVLAALGAVVRGVAAVVLVGLVSALVSDDPASAWPWLGALSAATIAGWSIDMVAARRACDVGSTLMNSVIDRLMDRLELVRLSWLGPERVTDVARTLSTVGQELFSSMSNLITPVITATLLPYSIAVALFFVDWQIALAALICAPLLSLARSVSSRLTAGAEERFVDANAVVDRRVVEFATHQQVLRAAGRSSAERSSLGDALVAQRRSMLGLVTWSVPGQIIFSVASQIALLALAAVTVHAWSDGRLGVAQTVAVFVVIVRYLEPFNEAAELSATVEAFSRTLGRVQTILEAPVVDGADVSGTLATTPGAAATVELRDVVVAFDGAPVLDGVTAVFDAGTTTAIIGPSGVGKSTALGAICRFVEPAAGQVRIDGVDISHVPAHEVLAQIALVSQDVYLFEGTVRDNVLHGRIGATEAELQAAAEMARVDEIVRRLPDGWDTRVGEGGVTLSGGERQRLGIARALLKRAPILLLDEATSALDPDNEAAILEAIAADRSTSRTVIVVAHRLSAVARIERVAIIDRGRVVAHGKRADLLADGGPLAAYWADDNSSWTLAGGDRS